MSTHPDNKPDPAGLTQNIPADILAAYPTQFGRPPDFVIGPFSDPYLLRWWVIPRSTERGNHYRHCILRDDDDRALHDHPWPSVSVVRSGILKEITPEGSRILEVGVPYFRKATALHRLEVIGDDPVWTDFYTGPKERTWGFQCPEDSPAGGWRVWHDFVAKNPGEVGRGCGEM